MKITTYITASMIVLSVFLLNTYAFAENSDSSMHQGSSGDKRENISEHSDESNNDESDGENNNQDEADIHTQIYGLKNIKDVVVLDEVNKDTIKTYADVVVILTKYQTALISIKTQASLGSQLTTTLVGNEKLLFEKLLGRHVNDFTRLDSRITEINTQIKEMIDILSPLGTADLTTSYGLDKLIISQINEFKSAINNLSDLGDLNIDAVDEETL